MEEAQEEAQNEEQQGVPRYRVMFQDGVTGVQIAAGTDELDKFTKSDLMEMVKAFKKNVEAEETSLRTQLNKEDKKRESGNSSNS